jgi:hypothetical protein
MFWKASSTLLASKADVSMNDRLFSPKSQECQWILCRRMGASSAIWPHTRKLLRLLRRHCPQMPQIALVTDQHDHDVGVGMVAQLLQPPCDVLICLVLADVVDKQRSHSAPVVGRGNGAVSLLACGIPDLSFDGLRVDLNRPRSEFDADCRLGIEVELVAGESAQQV